MAKKKKYTKFKQKPTVSQLNDDFYIDNSAQYNDDFYEDFVPRDTSASGNPFRPSAMSSPIQPQTQTESEESGFNPFRPLWRTYLPQEKFNYFAQPKKPERRNTLERFIDVLSAPMYGVMNMANNEANRMSSSFNQYQQDGNLMPFVKNALLSGTGVERMQDFGKGFMSGASAIWDDGKKTLKDGKTTSSDVFDTLGWKADESGKEQYTDLSALAGANPLLAELLRGKGKIKNNTVRSVASFGADVAGDPLTYATIGIAPLLKGTGLGVKAMKTAELTNNMLRTSATNAIKEGAEKYGFKAGDDILESLLNEANKLRGGVEGTEKRTLMWAKDKTLRKLGDATIAPYVNSTLEMLGKVPGVKQLGTLGDKMFYGGMKEVARTNPAEFFKQKVWQEAMGARSLERMIQQGAVHGVVNQMKGKANDDELRQITNILSDARLFHPHSITAREEIAKHLNQVTQGKATLNLDKLNSVYENGLKQFEGKRQELFDYIHSGKFVEGVEDATSTLRNDATGELHDVVHTVDATQVKKQLVQLSDAGLVSRKEMVQLMNDIDAQMAESSGRNLRISQTFIDKLDELTTESKDALMKEARVVGTHTAEGRSLIAKAHGLDETNPLDELAVTQLANDVGRNNDSMYLNITPERLEQLDAPMDYKDPAYQQAQAERNVASAEASDLDGRFKGYSTDDTQKLMELDATLHGNEQAYIDNMSELFRTKKAYEILGNKQKAKELEDIFYKMQDTHLQRRVDNMDTLEMLKSLKVAQAVKSLDTGAKDATLAKDIYARVKQARIMEGKVLQRLGRESGLAGESNIQTYKRLLESMKEQMLEPKTQSVERTASPDVVRNMEEFFDLMKDGDMHPDMYAHITLDEFASNGTLPDFVDYLKFVSHAGETYTQVEAGMLRKTYNAYVDYMKSRMDDIMRSKGYHPYVKAVEGKLHKVKPFEYVNQETGEILKFTTKYTKLTGRVNKHTSKEADRILGKMHSLLADYQMVTGQLSPGDVQRALIMSESFAGDMEGVTSFIHRIDSVKKQMSSVENVYKRNEAKIAELEGVGDSPELQALYAKRQELESTLQTLSDTYTEGKHAYDQAVEHVNTYTKEGVATDLPEDLRGFIKAEKKRDKKSAMKALEERKTALGNTAKELRGLYGESHPEYIQVNDEYNRVKKVLNSLQNDYQKAWDRIKKFNDNMKNKNAKIAELEKTIAERTPEKRAKVMKELEDAVANKLADYKKWEKIVADNAERRKARGTAVTESDLNAVRTLEKVKAKLNELKGKYKDYKNTVVTTPEELKQARLEMAQLKRQHAQARAQLKVLDTQDPQHIAQLHGINGMLDNVNGELAVIDEARNSARSAVTLGDAMDASASLKKYVGKEVEKRAQKETLMKRIQQIQQKQIASRELRERTQAQLDELTVQIQQAQGSVNKKNLQVQMEKLLREREQLLLQHARDNALVVKTGGATDLDSILEHKFKFKDEDAYGYAMKNIEGEEAIEASLRDRYKMTTPYNDSLERTVAVYMERFKALMNTDFEVRDLRALDEEFFALVDKQASKSGAGISSQTLDPRYKMESYKGVYDADEALGTSEARSASIADKEFKDKHPNLANEPSTAQPLNELKPTNADVEAEGLMNDLDDALYSSDDGLEVTRKNALWHINKTFNEMKKLYPDMSPRMRERVQADFDDYVEEFASEEFRTEVKRTTLDFKNLQIFGNKLPTKEELDNYDLAPVKALIEKFKNATKEAGNGKAQRNIFAQFSAENPELAYSIFKNYAKLDRELADALKTSTIREVTDANVHMGEEWATKMDELYDYVTKLEDARFHPLEESTLSKEVVQIAEHMRSAFSSMKQYESNLNWVDDLEEYVYLYMNPTYKKVLGSHDALKRLYPDGRLGVKFKVGDTLPLRTSDIEAVKTAFNKRNLTKNTELQTLVDEYYKTLDVRMPASSREVQLATLMTKMKHASGGVNFGELHKEVGEVVNKLPFFKNTSVGEMNKVLKEYYGFEGDVFLENIADIFHIRAMKNLDATYGENYVKDTLEVFGERVTAESELKNAVVSLYDVQNFVRSLKLHPQYTPELEKQILDDVFAVKSADSVMSKTWSPLIRLDSNQIFRLHKYAEEFKTTRVNAYNLPEYVYNQARQQGMTQYAKDKSAFLRLYDKFTYLWKLNATVIKPGFHVTNAIGNNFNTFLNVGAHMYHPSVMESTIALMAKKGGEGKLITKSGKEITHTEIWQNMSKYNTIDSNLFNKDFGADVGRAGTYLTEKPSMLSHLNPLDTDEFALYKAGKAVGSQTETFARVQNYVANLYLGKSHRDAGMNVNKYLFDYGDSTEFEDNVLKRLIPFYTWIKKNTHLQLTEVMNNPRPYAFASKIINNLESGVSDEEGVDKTKYGAWAEGYTQIPTQKENMTRMVNFSLPMNDLKSANPSNMLYRLKQQAHPLIRLGYEGMTGKSLAFGSEIDDKGLNALQTLLPQLASSTAVNNGDEGAKLEYFTGINMKHRKRPRDERQMPEWFAEWARKKQLEQQIQQNSAR